MQYQQKNKCVAEIIFYFNSAETRFSLFDTTQTLNGIQVMIDNKVPIQIVVRVNQDSNLRRSTDWKH